MIKKILDKILLTKNIKLIMVVKLMVNRLVFLDYVYVLYLVKIILRVESVFIVIWKFFR